MKKIPTVFKRNPDDMKHVLPEVTPGCEWVLAGEGRATRKYDGTCVLARDGVLYKRREFKDGKPVPPDFQEADYDPNTGKHVGWVPVDPTDKGDRWYCEVVAPDSPTNCGVLDGTYELCGPKVQGNPEGFEKHVLVPHEAAERYPALDNPQGYDELEKALTALQWEGIVWHHPDGRMAKLKRRDFV